MSETQTLYAAFTAHLNAALDALDALPAGPQPRRDHGRAAARCQPRRSVDQCRDGAGQASRHEPARIGRTAGRRTGEIAAGHQRRDCRAGFHQPAHCRQRLAGRTAGLCRAGRGLWPFQLGRRQHGQYRICLGQPHRANAYGSLPGRGGRRCLGDAAGVCRAQGDPRILCQRCRRAGRCPRPLCASAVSRGAWRGGRRNSGGALSGGISDPGWTGFGQGIRRQVCGCPRVRMARPVPHPRGRRHAGDDQGRSRTARHQARPVLVRGRASGQRQARRGRKVAARP